MIKQWLFQGDIHRQIDLLPKNLSPQSALIILGDVGFNICDAQATPVQLEIERTCKKYANSLKYLIYCVRGNHELRPEQSHPSFHYKKVYDNNVAGIIYVDPNYPNLRYFIDGEYYYINNYRTLVIGGAYSVDKFYRLQNNLFWNKKEQLDIQEQNNINKRLNNSLSYYDLILTHTCPYNWQPTDLFLDTINQSTVDNSMEKWLQTLLNNLQFKYWLFGHYHRDRYVNYELSKDTNIAQQAIMLYHNRISLDDLFKIQTYKDRPQWMGLSAWLEDNDAKY